MEGGKVLSQEAYKSKESFTTSKGIHRECKREETLRFKKILGA